ncbi:DNA-processing protein DprA [Rhodoferax sp.]|uniref:DNA-processing protein DprA n=1 Tax=Rhodoferax sp. TaxID=50421 RepID=UPI0027321EBB|nr:DNA-processing protein DprA [Rhodoferax sp.]MDP1528733.1 DNA-processing protein DprA [Rhodoferax sp.]MDP1943782.1 DNA-processing protein DprA [Rhodoferax sp.]MDP2441850.1 DNA-processing protein DprA [Rhodoferax sp.]MDZ4208134.1 DNA-processing protein DprA [Rhodoferax sp.]
MDRDELKAWLRLSLSPGIGNITARKLLACFGLPQAIFEQPSAALRQVATPLQTQALCTEPPALADLLETTWAWVNQSEVNGCRRQVLSLGDPGYPQALLDIDDPPLLLYLFGVASFRENQPAATLTAPWPITAQRCLAVVGSRNPTPQGAGNARLFAKSLVQAGLTVVSGLALGVDGAAHEGALEGLTEGATDLPATIAVIGTGLDRVYPKAHHGLAHRIAHHGLLLSEYPLGTPPINANFPKRNRLIAGLARGTLVVEAALKSGSLITARLTSEQGKDVFAIPGSIHAAQSRGCHALIKQGAKLVESAQDILEELQGFSARPATTEFAVRHKERPDDESALGDPGALLDALGFDPVGLDALQGRTLLETADLQAQLMALELDGLVARLPGGLYQRQSGA